MKIAILDGYTSTMGELDWKSFEAFGEVAVYDRTPKDKIIERARGAEARPHQQGSNVRGADRRPSRTCAI